MNYNELIFFDLETSGLIPEEHDIIQIAAIDAVTGDEFERYVRFKVGNASKAALEVNGYSEEVWDEKAVSQREAFEAFREFVQAHAKQTRISRRTGNEYKVAVMAGHNIDKFDMQFLKMWEQRLDGYLNIDYACYDTLQLARWLLPNIDTGYRLEELANYFKIAHGKSHNALEDVRMNIQVAAKLVTLLTWESPRWAKLVQNKEK